MLTPLTTTPAPLLSSARRTLGPAWHERRDGLHVVKLKGSAYEMGRQHGVLLRDVIPGGPIPYYRAYFEKLIGRAALGPLGPLVWPTLQALVGTRVGRQMPRFAEDTIRGLAEGAGLRFEDVYGGCTMPDSMIWLAARLQQLRAPGPAVVHRLSLGLGCTSAIAWGEASRDGKLHHARNFDYHGVSCWPGTQAVLFHEPDEGQRYVSIAAAGVVLGGITAMNEAGLTLTVHQHMFTDQSALGGTPIGAMGDEVMRKAETLDDAEKLLAGNRPIGCWTYVMTDGKTNEVMCFEESPRRHTSFRLGGGRPMDPRAQKAKDTFGYANVYLDEQLGRTETNLYGSYWRHNAARHRTANERLAEGAGRHDAESVARILADRGHEACRVSEASAMVMTVGSVVFRPEDGLVWVGTGEAPTSRNRFVAFDLRGERRAGEHASFVVDDGESDASRRAFERYRDAYVLHVDHGDAERALAAMNEACALAPEEPVFHFLRGLLALDRRAHTTAEDALTRAIAIGHPHAERRASFHLWRARVRSEMGRRDDAITDYRACLGLPADPPVHAAARREHAKGWSGKRRAIDFSMGDVVSP
ncbi:MAG: hypothetical protein J0L92_27240 [Deltaproteobacteria bacterium]|nr:hypothetical protein [Deltaproteobacteria bacterium]